MARVCGGGDVAGGVTRGHAHSACMAHCVGPGARQAAQAPAAERQACPCAEGACGGSLGRVRVSAVGPKSRIRCAPA
eukprot:7036883-Prymnesium_polylepis.1